MQSGEAFSQFIGRIGFYNAFNALDLQVSFLHFGAVHQLYLVAMAQVIGLHAVKGGVVAVVGLKSFQGLFFGNEFGAVDIFNAGQSGADTFCLSIREGLIDIDQDLIGFIHVVYHDVDIIHQAGEAANDQQAGHRNADGGEGHKAVLKNATDALFE